MTSENLEGEPFKQPIVQQKDDLIILALLSIVFLIIFYILVWNLKKQFKKLFDKQNIQINKLQQELKQVGSNQIIKNPLTSLNEEQFKKDMDASIAIVRDQLSQQYDSQNQSLKDQIDKINQNYQTLSEQQQKTEQYQTLQQQQQKEIDQLKNDMKEKIQKSYQEEINKLKDQFQQEIRKPNEQSQEEIKKLKDQFQQEIRKLNEQSQEEIKKLKDQFQEEIRKPNEQSQEVIKKLKDQFSEEIRKLNEQSQEEIKKLKDQLNNQNSEISKINGMFTNSQDEIKQLKDQFNNQNLEISKINDMYKNSQEVIKKLNDQLSNQNLEISKLNDMFKHSQEVIQILNDQFDQLQGKINKLNEMFTNNQEEIRQLNEQFNHLNLQIIKLNDLFTNSQDEIKKLKNDIQQQMSQNVNKNEIDIQNLQTQISILGKQQEIGIQNLTNEVQDLMKKFSLNFDDIKSEFQEMQKNIQNIDLEVQNLIKQYLSILPSPPKPPVINFDTIISSLYNKTCRVRQVEPQYRLFVSDILSSADLIQEYSVNQLEIKNQLKQHFSGMRRARGDGNCFYTSFVFQYLDFMINKTKKEQFQELVQQIQMLPFVIQFENEEYNQNDFDNLKQKFIGICQQLRQQKKQDRQNLFFEYFKDEQNEFYGLSIVFLRNLAFKFCSENEEASSIFQAQGFNLQKELLQWEFDCQSNEIVINQLSKNLNIHTIQFVFQNNEQPLNILQYNETSDPMLKIYLLFRPGHYNIGVPKSI